MKLKTLLFLFLLTTLLYACEDEENEQPVNCTEEFRTELLHVPGEPLIEAYTIRLSNLDTIRHLGYSEMMPGYYMVLNDSYLPKLKNQQDTFRFIGKRDGRVVVREDYVFKADQCHITKVSGKQEL
jgi:hypothetical protein